MNNKGLSLIELLVAMAVSAIVITMISFLLIRGTTQYERINTEITLQDESQIIMNHLKQAFMEATFLHINNEGKEVYTGDIDSSLELKIVNGTERHILVEDNKLYIISKNGVTDKKGYTISSLIKDFKIEFDESCKYYTTPDVNLPSVLSGYKNPLVLKVSYTLEKGKETKTQTALIKLRNNISVVKIDGIEQYIIK